LTKLGGGGLNLAGTSPNTYTGTTIVSNGIVEVNKPGGTRAVSGNVIIGDGVNSPVNAELRVFDPGHLPRTANVLVRQSGLFDVSGGGAILGGLTGSGNLNLAGPLTVSNSASCVFDGAVSGSGALNKLGLATLRFTGNGSAYTGPATVFDGTYKVDGYFPSSPVTVKLSSLLRGNGTVGDVTVENGGEVKVDPSAPGQLSGEMVMNSANFQPGGVLGLGFHGPHATGGNDSLFVNNAVTLTSPTLSSGFQYPPHEGDVITLISKDAAGAVSGAFSGFPEGAARMIGNIPVVMSYVGGNGNDVTLTVSGLPLQSGGAQILSGNGGGGVFVPNDCSLLTLIVTNRGSTTVSNLHGTLRSLTPGVVATIPESTFPNLAPNAPGSNATPFQIRTEETFPCGSGAQFELVLTASNLPPTAILYTFLGGSGYGLNFGGGDDRVDVRTNLFSRVTNNFTIEFWANPTGTRVETPEMNTGISPNVSRQRFAVFPDRGDLSYGPGHVGAGLSIGRNGISVFEYGTNYIPSPLVYSNDLSGWSHVALVYNNRRPRLYVNGTLARTGLLSPAPFIHASANLGGSIHGVGNSNYRGQLDEVRIWNVALSQTQIQTNMLRTLAGTESGLVVYYRCDEGEGTALTDSAPASPNISGTLANGAAFVFPGVVPFPLPDGVDCNAGGGACESCLVVSGRFTGGLPAIAQRLNFTGSPSVCYPPKPCPDLDPLPDLVPDVPPVRNLVHGFANPTTNELCVTAQLHFDCPAAPFGSLGIAAYLGSFNPAQPCATYLGDGGGDGPPYPPFSFRVPAGSNFAVVVTARDTNLVCDTYTLELFGLPCPPPMLHIARDTTPGKVLLQWSSAYPAYRLQSTGALPVSGPAAFSNVTVSPVLVSGKFAVSNSVAAPRQFFRLELP
jgi:autotransporter-associated beta strand protein